MLYMPFIAKLEIVVGAPALTLNVEMNQFHDKHLTSCWHNNLKWTRIISGLSTWTQE